MSEHSHSFQNYSVIRAVFPQLGVVASLVGCMHATTLPTMYSKLIPRQLSQWLRSPFLAIPDEPSFSPCYEDLV